MTNQECWDALPTTIVSTICGNIGCSLMMSGRPFLTLDELSSLVTGWIGEIRAGSNDPLDADQKRRLMVGAWVWCSCVASGAVLAGGLPAVQFEITDRGNGDGADPEGTE
ncbi:MAG: hypothetical protein ACK4WH_00890 [Phycisphaerales bacterium]